MGELNPKGTSIMLGGKERRLLFTLNAIDEIQERFGLPLEEAISQLTDMEKANGALKAIITILVNDEIERLSYKGKECSLKPLDEKEVGWMVTSQDRMDALMAVLKAYGGSLPEPGEGESPNQESGQQDG